MKRRLICCSFATKEGYNGSANMNNSTTAVDVYIKNACVCCFSAKVFNSDCDVAFIHNLKTLPEQYDNFFKEHNILVFYVPYDKYVFVAEYKWSLAYYKLCVLDYLAYHSQYDSILLLDTDTIFIGAVDAVWTVSEERLMLYNVQHAYDLDAYQGRIKEYRDLYQNKSFPMVWGGEFLAANVAILQKFMIECEQVYKKILDTDFKTMYGDEFITFCAAENYKGKISDATPYIRRYWTANIYYQAFTDHDLMLRILHIPNEKNHGFLRIYKYISRYGKLPEKKVIFQIMGLPKTKRPIYLRNVGYQLVRKIKRFFEIYLK